MEHHEQLQPVLTYYRRWKRLPSLRELADLWGFKAHESARKAVTQLIEQGYFIKDRKTGSLLPGRALTRVRVLGSVTAGFPSPAEEELGDTIDLNELLAALASAPADTGPPAATARMRRRAGCARARRSSSTWRRIFRHMAKLARLSSWKGACRAPLPHPAGGRRRPADARRGARARADDRRRRDGHGGRHAARA